MNNSKKEQTEQVFKKVHYADSNLFIYAVTNADLIGRKAKEILEKTKQGNIKLRTSTLTIDEFLWRVKKEVGGEDAVNAAQIFFTLSNLELINVDSYMISEAIEIYKKENLELRDAIHLAAMRSKNLQTIFSTDPDFDQIKNIKRIDYSK
jgi:predicted nucleic acid-binding protein